MPLVVPTSLLGLEAEVADPDDRELAETALKKTKKQAEKIKGGDTSEETQNALLKRLKVLYNMAGDIGEVTIKALVNPAWGISDVIRKIAKKAEEEVKAVGDAHLTENNQ